MNYVEKLIPLEEDEEILGIFGGLSFFM